jgi:hypothetical protein
VRPEDAADEGAGAREPALKRPRMMEGAASESAHGSVSALEKREGGGLKARGAGGKAKRPLNVTLTAGGKPTDVGRREEEPALKDVIDATSATEAAAHQSEGGAGEGRGKRVRKAPKPFGED